MATGTTERFAEELGKLLQPLTHAMTPAQVINIFGQLGLRPPTQLLADAGFTTAIASTATVAGQLPADIRALATAIEADDTAATLSASATLVTRAGTLTDSFVQIKTALQAVSGLPGSTADADLHAFAVKLPERLLDYLIITYLWGYYPLLCAMLEVVGIVELTYDAGDPTNPMKPPYVVRRLNLPQLGALLNDPIQALQALYGWGSPGFTGARLLETLGDVGFALGVPAVLVQPTTPGTRLTLRVGGLSLFARTDLTPPGLELDLSAGLADGLKLSVPLMKEGWSLELDVEGAIQTSTSATLQPPAALIIHPPAGLQLKGKIEAAVVGAPASPQQRLVIFGQTGGSRLDAAGVRLALGGAFSWDTAANSAHGEFMVEGQITKGQFVISLQGSDGFLAKILPPNGIQFDFDFGLGWSERRGVYFTGNAGLETNVGLHVSIGPFKLESLHLALVAGASGIQLESSVTGSGVLGPVSASVERIGLLTDLKFQKGNLGPVDLGLAFKYPNGLGIVVDAGVVTGGGFIRFDPPNGRYAGGIELKIEEIVVKAYCLLDTKLRDGKLGFSFLILITAEFTPMQLGFGFTLDGVGGLAGINRTLVLDALQAGFRAHSINSILFPDIHNAQKIISDLRAIFPPAEGRYVFGPMVKIGWGSPNLVVAEIGIVLEIPAPIRLAILGLIVAALPEDDDEDTVILIHLDVLGIVDFGLKKLAIDAMIYDSRVVAFSLFGDMALRLSWGADATFAFSLGGLHPQFQPPPAFPHLRRLTLSIGDGDNPRLSLTTYMAVTSNTVQFGADLELYAAYGGFKAHGYLAFDALFVISPFSFTTEMRAGVDVQYNGVSFCGISLDFILTGPTPWTYAGTVTLHILFWDVSVGVSGKFGSGTAKELPAEPVMTPLLKALNDARSWTAVLPDGATRGVSFIAQKPDDTTIYVHPTGQLTVRQSVVPLSTQITKFGSARPSDGDEFDITGATLKVAGTTTPVNTTPVTDPFARAQYEDMNDGAKLAAKSYEPFTSGVTLGDPAVKAGSASTLDLHYDTQIIDDIFMPARPGPRYRVTLDLQNALGRQGAGELSPLRSMGNARYMQPGMTSPITTPTQGFVITSVDDLSVRYDITGGEATTQRAASLQLEAHLARNPHDVGRLQIMPVHEVAA